MWMVENFYAGGRETDDQSDRLILLTDPSKLDPPLQNTNFIANWTNRGLLTVLFTTPKLPD
jgi:hypothetical protein